MSIKTTADTYLGPLDGFRGKVTRASERAIRKAGGVCPGCDEKVPRGHEREHAIDCFYLRADVADGL